MTVHSPLLCSLLLGTLVLSGCKTRSPTPQAPKESVLPCWVQTPKQANQLGFVGTAAPFSAIPNGSELASRTRALKKLAAYHNIRLQRRDMQNVTHDQPTQVLSSGHTVYYSTPFNTEDTQYSYVSFEPLKTSATCAVRQCDFVQCQPAWLCDNDTHRQVLGVSYYTASPHEQLQISERNAMTVASFLMQAQVNATEYLKQRAVSREGNVHHEVNYNRNGEVDALGTPTHLALHQSCQYGSTLIGQYKPADQAVINTPVLPDINDMTQQGKLVLGAFGEDGTMTSDNLLSTAIRLAIQDALIELAKNKGITIETQVEVTQHKGHYLLESSEFTINEHVSGELIDLKIQYKNDVPVIYVWLLEIIN
ncbi:hypothetical protein PRUB_a3688 [Pseudoalteromonas rubra]|uniref:Uncharacterized protein n=1 Tax=Pseudoalteromonas rubra TaxID=43658 RepID=A0A8T0C9Y8_9GAMM|nr:hypothetical protein [Pseudoalteromonas rubra]KAF7786881.1 hypothetical protein PRUB_a3688 [Pseudoalteromonas rubra]